MIDAGLSVRELTRRLASIGEKPEDLDAVLITHEHSDHISGLPRLVRARAKKKKPIAVFVSRLTAPMIDWEAADDVAPAVEHFQAGSGWTVGDIEVQSFSIPHDAVDPVGFCFEAQGVRSASPPISATFRNRSSITCGGVHFLLLEANHDLEMLKVGPYPWSVKQRVMSRVGHLSNLVHVGLPDARIWIPARRTLILGHLSEHNNHPEIVRDGRQPGAGPARPGTATCRSPSRTRPSEVFQF